MPELQRALGELRRQRGGPHVSIYLPIDGIHPDRKTSVIELENLLRQATHLLQESEADAPPSLEPLRESLEQAVRLSPAPGIAAFHGPGGTRVLPLPRPLEALVVVEDRFHLKPLLALLDDAATYFLLVLSQGGARVLRGSLSGIEELDLGERLRGLLAEIMGGSEGSDEASSELQSHSGHAGGATPVHHGHDAADRAHHDAAVHRFLRVVDDALSDRVQKQPGPIVAFGDTRLLSSFRGLSANAARIVGEVRGNADGASAGELVERAAPALDDWRNECRRAAAAKLQGRRAAGRACAGLREVLAAAHDGRIETLLLDRTRRIWGTYDNARRSVHEEKQQSADNEDLLDLAAVRTYEQGGRVLAVEPSLLPKNTATAALLRY